MAGSSSRTDCRLPLRFEIHLHLDDFILRIDVSSAREDGVGAACIEDVVEHEAEVVEGDGGERGWVGSGPVSVTSGYRDQSR